MTATDPTTGGPDDAIGRVLGALADGTRRGIVRALAGGATPTASELARELPITRQAVTKHLKVLADAEVIDAERRGREARYRLRPERLELASRWIDEVGATWDHRLADLKRQVEADHRGDPDV